MKLYDKKTLKGFEIYKIDNYSSEKVSNKSFPLETVLRWAYEKEDN